MDRKQYTNVSFILLPFQFDIDRTYGGSIADFCEKLRARDPEWELQTDRIDYMFRYVTDKIISEDVGKRLCFHFKRKGQNDVLYCFGQESFQFQIQSEELFAFSTGIGMYAFQIWIKPEDNLEYVDIRTISKALFYLKNAGHAFKSPEDEKLSFLGIASDHCRIVGKDAFFFHADCVPRLNKRANVMSLSMQAGVPDYNGNEFGEKLLRDLYHYRYCYGDGFHYVSDKESEKRELVSLTREIIWGLSDESMVAAAYPEMYPDCENFVRNVFYKNFTTNYLFMYVFLLHQKYVLYHFMTELEPGSAGKLEALQDYSRKLYRYETYYEYSRISDVPQYERLYEMQVEALDIPQLFKDVREPLEALRHQKEQDEAQRQAERESKINRMLAWVGLLAIFSAFTDSFDFVEKFLNVFGVPLLGIHIVQFIFAAIILVVAVLVIKESAALFWEERRRKK